MATLLRKEILVYFGGKIIPAVLNFALIILAIRWLGKENYGKYSLIFYAVMLVSTFTFGWIQQSILRFQSAYKNRINIATNRFFILTILSSLAGVIIIAIAGPLYFDLSVFETLIVVATLLFYNVLLFQLTNYQARFKSIKYALTESSYNIVMFGVFAALVFIAGQRTWLSLFIAMLTGFVVVDLVQLITVKRNNKRSGWSGHYWNKEFAAKMFAYGFLISVWLSVSYLFNVANRFIIKEYCGYAEVGIFSSVYDIIFKISGFICMPILLAYHPRITAYWNEGRKNQALKETQMALKLEVLVFAAVFIVFMAGRSLLFDQVLKLEAGNLTLFSVALIISAFGWQAALLIHKPLELLLRVKEMIFAILISLIINVAGNLIFIPVYGYQAAAYTTLAGVLIYILLTWFMSKRFMKSENPNG